MDQVYESKQCRIGFASQADFDVPAIDAAAVTEVSVEQFDIEDGTKRHEVAGVYGTRNDVTLNTVHSTSGAISTFTTVGPVNLDTIDQFLYAHFQDVIELADTEFTKTFNYFLDQPDFSANAGHFLTWFKRFPTASASYKLGACIANSFKISGERDGLIMAEFGWVGLGVPSVTSNPGGTWTLNSASDFLEFNDIASATLMIAPVTLSPFSIILQSFEVAGSYDVIGIGQDATDGFASYGLSNRKGTFSVTILRDTNVDELIAAARSGAMLTFALDLGTMTIQVTGQLESKTDSTDGLAAVTLNCKVAADISSVGVVDDDDVFEIVVQNSHDRSWPAA